MVDAVERNGTKFNYGTQRRFMPFYRKMRELIDAGEIGDVQCVIAQYGATSALWGLTHAADMLLYLAGDVEIDFVQGSIMCDPEDWDGNRLNTDPGIGAATSVFPTESTATTQQAPVLNLRCAAQKEKCAPLIMA